jgi:hypothetical protein
MSDTIPDDQPRIPDAVSPQVLSDALNALGKGLPPASNLPQIQFGDASKHEGIHDLHLLLGVLCSDSSRKQPVMVQLIHAACGLAELIHKEAEEGFAMQKHALADQMREFAGSNPARSAAAAAALDHISKDADGIIARAAEAALALQFLRDQSLEAQIFVESFNLLGSNTPRPGNRQRFVSDDFLDSVGISRTDFDIFFQRHTAG